MAPGGRSRCGRCLRRLVDGGSSSLAIPGWLGRKSTETTEIARIVVAAPARDTEQPWGEGRDGTGGTTDLRAFLVHRFLKDTHLLLGFHLLLQKDTFSIFAVLLGGYRHRHEPRLSALREERLVEYTK